MKTMYLKTQAIFAALILVSPLATTGVAHAAEVSCSSQDSSVKLDEDLLLPLAAGKTAPVDLQYTLSGQTRKLKVTCKLVHTSDDEFACGQEFDGIEHIGLSFTDDGTHLSQVTVLSEVHGGFGSEVNHFFLSCK